MIISEAKFQIGKAGLTDGVAEALKLIFKTHKRIRVSVLKSAARDKNSIKAIAEGIKSKLNGKCDYKVIGFTIILIRRSAAKEFKAKEQARRELKAAREQ
jgi:RNA-binding protein YhbY